MVKIDIGLKDVRHRTHCFLKKCPPFLIMYLSYSCTEFSCPELVEGSKCPTPYCLMSFLCF